MRCPRCGSSVSDSESFCPYCGEQMTDDVIAKSNKPLLIAMIAIVLALLVVTFLAFTGKFSPHDDEPEPVAEATIHRRTDGSAHARSHSHAGADADAARAHRRNLYSPGQQQPHALGGRA